MSAGDLGVAIVGTGPAGMFVAEELLAIAGPRVQLSIFDHLPVVGGLVRHGVAPDHLHAKYALRPFMRMRRTPGYPCFSTLT